jgi:hypothetical protein
LLCGREDHRRPGLLWRLLMSHHLAVDGVGMPLVGSYAAIRMTKLW